MKSVVAQLPDCKMSYIAPTPPGFMYYIYGTPLNGVPYHFDGMDPLQMVSNYYMLGQPLYQSTTTYMSFTLQEYINNQTVAQGTVYGNSITITNFSMVAEGWMRVSQTGNYTFMIDSDYAASLHIFSNPLSLCFAEPFSGTNNYPAFYIANSVTQHLQQTLSGQVYLVAGVAYQMGVSYIHPSGAPTLSVSVVDANGQYHPDIGYLLSTLDSFSAGTQWEDFEQVNVTSAIGYGGATTTLFSVASNAAIATGSLLTVTTTFYYYTPTTTASYFTTVDTSTTPVIFGESSAISTASNSSITVSDSASTVSSTIEISPSITSNTVINSTSTVSITVEISPSTTTINSTSYSGAYSSSVGFSFPTSESVSSMASNNVSRTLFDNSFNELTSLTSDRGQDSEISSKISETIVVSNQISITKSSQGNNMVEPTSLIFANSSSTPSSASGGSFDISALPRAQGLTGTDSIVESSSLLESGINGMSTTGESTVTQRVTHTSYKISSMELSFIGFPMSHSISTETASGIEYIVIILECPACENGVTVITPSGINDNNAVATETGEILQITSHVSSTRDSVLFVGADYSDTSAEGLDNLATSIPIMETNTPFLSSIGLNSNVRPTVTTNSIIEALGGGTHYKDIHSFRLFGAIILYFIF